MASPFALSVRLYADRAQQAKAVAAQLAKTILQSAQTPNAQTVVVTVALAGGETPKPAYEALTKHAIAWEQTVFYPTDERCVAADHPRRNDAMLKATLGERAQVASLQDHMRPPRLDVVLLGMGEDGHIASVFPDTFGEDAGQKCVYKIHPAAASEPRLTMPMSALAAAPHAILMTSGESKWQRLANPSAPLAAYLAHRQAHALPPLTLHHAP